MFLTPGFAGREFLTISCELKLSITVDSSYFNGIAKTTLMHSLLDRGESLQNRKLQSN